MERVARVALAAVPLLVLGIFFLVPVAGVVVRGLSSGDDLAHAVDVVLGARTARVVWFTLWSSAAGAAAAVLLGLPVAFVLYRLRWPGARLARSLVAVPFVLPTVVVAVAFRQLTQSQSVWVILAAFAFFNLAVVVRQVGPAWAGLGGELGEVAATLGAGPVRAWWSVTLPALRPVILGSAVVVLLFCSTSFGLVLILGGMRHATVETEIYLRAMTLLDLPGAAALTLVQIAGVVVLLALAGRLGGGAGSVGTGLVDTVTHTRGPRRADLPAVAVTALAGAFLLAPLAALVLGALHRSGEWTLANFTALAHGGTPQVPVSALHALGTSMLTAVVATAVAVGLGLWAALVRARWTRAVFALPLGVSAVILGFGLLITLSRPPVDFRGEWWLVPLAQALVALPLVIRALGAALDGIDQRLRDAATSLGAGPVRRFLSVDAVALRRPLVGVAGLAFAVSMGEFGATSFLSRAGSPTLPVLIGRLIGRPGAENYGMALAASVVLAAAVVAVMTAAEGFARRSLD